MIEGDTALTPNQGGTGGSYGIARGGSQLRRAAATARRALVDLAAQRLGRPAGDLEVADGVVRGKDGSGSVSYGELIGDRALQPEGRRRGAVEAPRSLPVHRQVAAPARPAREDHGPPSLSARSGAPGMLHARVIRPPALGATLVSVDESSIAGIGGARVVRIQSFLAVVAEREWDAVRAARALKTQWTAGTGLPDHATEFEAMRASRVVRDQEIAKRGDLAALSAPPPGTRTLAASYRWPMQTHGSIGPSCGVADVRADRVTVWSVVAERARLPGHVRADARRRARSGARHLHGRRGLLRPQRGRRRGRGGDAALQGRRPPGARAVDPPGGARARSEGPRPAPRAARRRGQGRRGRRVGDAGVAAHRHRQSSQHPAAGRWTRRASRRRRAAPPA